MMAVAACSKSSSDTAATPLAGLTQTAVVVQSGATYYWKVVADDGIGGKAESETRTFTMQ